MKDEQRIKAIEDELKVLKYELKAVLLDLREQYLNIQNPFNSGMIPSGPVSGAKAPSIERVENEESGDTVLNQNVTKDSVSNDITQNPISSLRSEDSSSNFKNKPQFLNEKRLDDREINELYSVCDSNNKFISDSNGDDGGGEFIPVTPNIAPRAKKRVEQNARGLNDKLDLVVIAGLTQWIDQATARLGKGRAEALIEILFTMGRLPQNLKDALIRVARLSQNESSNQPISASDYLEVIAQLESLLSGSQFQANALLSILTMMKDTHDG